MEKLISPIIIKPYGDNTKNVEEFTPDSWHEIVDQGDNELQRLNEMVHDILERNHDLFINVNRYYGGSAPRTIEKINTLLHSTLSGEH